MKLPRRALSLTIATLLVAGTAASCSASREDEEIRGVSASRSKIYNSVDELRTDSEAIAVVRVSSQEVTASTPVDGLTYTISTAEVLETADISDLATPAPVSPGENITIRQHGDATMAEVPTPLLESGETYLVFLVLSGLDGPEGDQFYITGSSAGLFEAHDPSELQRSSDIEEASFSRVHDEGDVLPDRLTLEGLSRD